MPDGEIYDAIERFRRDSFPHTRGGGPHRKALPEWLKAFSPHAWGWTDINPTVSSTEHIYVSDRYER